MRIVIVGPGRAGLALAIAARDAGHEIVGVVGRDRDHAGPAAERLATAALAIGANLPASDLVVVATRDRDLPVVATDLAGAGGIGAAVHMSGLAPVGVLEPLEAKGARVGSLHPLQSLPGAEIGAAALAGAWVAVTAVEPLRSLLHDLARSLHTQPFDLADEHKALYHAGAAAAANFPLASLTMASDLLEAAGVPFRAARPLVEAVVANAFEIGPRPALTGPIARGDVETVEAQLRAVAASQPEWLEAYEVSVAAVARITGLEALEDVLVRQRWDVHGDEAAP